MPGPLVQLRHCVHCSKPRLRLSSPPLQFTSKLTLCTKNKSINIKCHFGNLPHQILELQSLMAATAWRMKEKAFNLAFQGLRAVPSGTPPPNTGLSLALPIPFSSFSFKLGLLLPGMLPLHHLPSGIQTLAVFQGLATSLISPINLALTNLL